MTIAKTTKTTNTKISADNKPSSRQALLLVNTGSPKSLDPQDIRAFLNDILLDPFVVDNAIVRFFLKRLIIPLYYKKSAQKYQSLNLSAGFPLIINSQRLAALLSERLKSQEIDCDVFCAMRYEEPSLEKQIETLSKTHEQLCVLPLFPQYSQSATKSIIEFTQKTLNQQSDQPHVDYLHDFHDADEYIDAIEMQIRTHWHQHGFSGFLLFSFHGQPNHVNDGYIHQCEKTAGLLASRLQLKHGQYAIVYQSRFGYGKWSEPELETTLADLARMKQHEVDIICPGFICDNLETFYDVDQKARDHFYAHGGKKLTRIDCLNANDFWVKRLAHLVDKHFGLSHNIEEEAVSASEFSANNLVPDAIINDEEI